MSPEEDRTCDAALRRTASPNTTNELFRPPDIDLNIVVMIIFICVQDSQPGFRQTVSHTPGGPGHHVWRGHLQVGHFLSHLLGEVWPLDPRPFSVFSKFQSVTHENSDTYLFCDSCFYMHKSCERKWIVGGWKRKHEWRLWGKEVKNEIKKESRDLLLGMCSSWCAVKFFCMIEHSVSLICAFACKHTRSIKCNCIL